MFMLDKSIHMFATVGGTTNKESFRYIHIFFVFNTAFVMRASNSLWKKDLHIGFQSMTLKSKQNLSIVE